VNERWPVIEDLVFPDPRYPPRPPAKVYGAHYWDEDFGFWIPMEHTPDDVPDSVKIPYHVMVFNKKLRGQPDTLFMTFQHEVAHHAGWGKKDEKKVDTLETCGIRNVQREDTIWKEKEDQTEHDPPPIDTLMIEMGGETSQHCYLCTFERRISNCRDIGNDTWCEVKWHMIDCEYVGPGACSQYGYAYAPLQPRPPPAGEGVMTVLACGGATAPSGPGGLPSHTAPGL